MILVARGKYPSHGLKWQPWSESVAATYDNL